jgi:hypothetical protein
MKRARGRLPSSPLPQADRPQTESLGVADNAWSIGQLVDAVLLWPPHWLCACSWRTRHNRRRWRLALARHSFREMDAPPWLRPPPVGRSGRTARFDRAALMR